MVGLFRVKFTLWLAFQAVSLVNSRIVETDLGEVIFANVLFRHGDRTPIEPYPNDPYGNTSFWPVGYGQLTNTGKEQEYELGQWLRNRYDALLTEQYSKDIIYVRSTDVDRTLMSAESSLAGMYPPKEAQVWNENINWQPIPVHTVPETLDSLLAWKKPCAAYDQEFNDFLKSEEFQAINNSFSKVYKVANEYSGWHVTSLEGLDKIYNTLWIENLYNFTLPEWVKPIYPHPIAEASMYNFAVPTWTKKLARLRTGLLVYEMIHNMKHKVTKEHRRNMNLYSAHDSTVSGLMNTLGVYNMINPPYTACFMIELRVNSSGSGHLVTMFYRNSSSEEPHLITLPGCTAACPLDTFITLLEPVTVKDWESECQVSIFSSYSTLTIIALVVLVGLVVVLLGSGAVYWTRRKRATYWYRKLKTDNL